MSDVFEKLIKDGVKNLNEYGYTDVTEDTIMTDFVCSTFFESMLKQN